MLQQDTGDLAEWQQQRFSIGGFAQVPPGWLDPGDIYRRPGLPDRVVAEVRTAEVVGDDYGGFAPTIVFEPVDGAPAWHRPRTATVEAARSAEVDIDLRRPRHTPSAYGVGDVQRLWFTQQVFAWVPGRVLRPGDEIDTEWFGCTYRTVAGVSADRATVTLEPSDHFPDDDVQLHGAPNTLYWARRPASAAEPTGRLADLVLAAARRIRSLGPRGRRVQSHA